MASIRNMDIHELWARAAPVQVNVTACPAPFIDATLHPKTGGEIGTRFCASPNPAITCCLPCPLTEWVFDDDFRKVVPLANYISIVAFVLNCFLILTWLLTPKEKSHPHYLSLGLVISLLLLSIAFIIPLSTHPDQCYDPITPNNFHSDLSCAWSGSLLLVGAMGTASWILLRSIWTALRIMFGIQNSGIFKWSAVSTGIALPVLFMGVCLGVTGVSYRLWNVCIPNGKEAFQTWFVWILIFSGLSAVVLIITILFCIWKFAINVVGGNARTQTHDSSGAPTKQALRKQGWVNVRKILFLQWRTILLSFIVLNITIFYGLTFVSQTEAIEASSHGITPKDEAWGICLIATKGDKRTCLPLADGLGLSQERVVATLVLASLLGPLVFVLMIRKSMLEGWLILFRNPRSVFQRRRTSVGSQDFIMQQSPKHVSLGRELESEKKGGAGHVIRDSRSINAVVNGGTPGHSRNVTQDSRDLERGTRSDSDDEKVSIKEMDEDEVLV